MRYRFRCSGPVAQRALLLTALFLSGFSASCHDPIVFTQNQVSGNFQPPLEPAFGDIAVASLELPPGPDSYTVLVTGTSTHVNARLRVRLDGNFGNVLGGGTGYDWDNQTQQWLYEGVAPGSHTVALQAQCPADVTQCMTPNREIRAIAFPVD